MKTTWLVSAVASAYFAVVVGPAFAAKPESAGAAGSAGKGKGSHNTAPAPDTSPDAAALDTPGSSGPGVNDLDLMSLKTRYQNSVVKIEFTAISNQEETKLNPTKSESYYSGSEPPHGSGFFVSESEIVTNAHVVEQARRGSIRIKSPAAGNVEFKAEVMGVGGSETIDLAVLKLPKDEVARLKKRAGLATIPTLEFGDSDYVRQADPVAIFGYPQSSDELKIIQAKVTGREYLRLGRGRFICGHQFIEVGPGGVVQPGNSGGPALDRAGKVVGIPARGSGYGSEQGFIIPSKVVTHFLKEIQENEAGHKHLVLPKLGVMLTENFAGTNVWSGAPNDTVLYELGVLVGEVVKNSLAERWGLKEGDIVLGFANKERNISAAIDFGGYRVVTGRMSSWPQALGDATQEPTTAATAGNTSETPKLHLSEMVMLSEPGDAITLWYVRRGVPGVQTIAQKMEYVEPANVPHLGTFEKPKFELWGDFVAQDFNDFNVALFEVPLKEIQAGGVLVTFVEPNSLASRRGMDPTPRSLFGFSLGDSMEMSTQWVIIDTVNGEKVKSLKELQGALRKAEGLYEGVRKGANWKDEHKPFTKERYVEVGFRTNSRQGTVLHLSPAFPIDEALEAREGVRETARAMSGE